MLGADGGVEITLERVDIVGRHQLAWPAPEGWVVGQQDAAPEHDHEAAEVGRDLGQACRRQRQEL